MTNSTLPKNWTIAQQATAQLNDRALQALDHTIRTTALRAGADPHTIPDLIQEARSIFHIVNAIPRALGPQGHPILGDNNLPITVETWLHRRLNL